MKERIFLTSFGKDSTGIIATITATLLTYNINIADLTQKIIDDNFVLFMVLDCDTSSSIENLQKHLEQATSRFRLKIVLAHENLFNATHRI
jgi:predicted amino acid-binding ACT domain protein